MISHPLLLSPDEREYFTVTGVHAQEKIAPFQAKNLYISLLASHSPSTVLAGALLRRRAPPRPIRAKRTRRSLHAVKFTALGDVANHRIPRLVELPLAAAALEDWLLLVVRDEALGIQRSP